MRVLIVGAGHAGLGVAQQLAASGHDVAVLDRERHVVERASERHGLVAMVGDATIAAVLEDAEIERTDVVVAMLRRDADNLAVALLARSRGVSQVLVRVRDVEYRSVYQAAGIERLLSETDLLVGALATTIEYPSVRHAMYLGDGASVAFEFALPIDSKLDGRTVVDVAGLGDFPSSCVFAGIYGPDGEVSAPRGSSVLRGGATLLVVARRAELHRVIAFLAATKLA